MKNVGKPCDREGHARIDGRELETERTSATVTKKNSLAGNHEVTSGFGAYRRSTSPRQLSTLHGLFGRVQLYQLLRRVNTYLMRWARKKYKRLRGYKRFHKWWTGLLDREPGLFTHWSLARTYDWKG